MKKLKVNFVFIPNQKEIYDSKKRKKNSTSKKQKILCAKYRKGHFEGVIDVMNRLTDIIRPKKYSWEKKIFNNCILSKNILKKNKIKNYFL